MASAEAVAGGRVGTRSQAKPWGLWTSSSLHTRASHLGRETARDRELCKSHVCEAPGRARAISTCVQRHERPVV